MIAINLFGPLQVGKEETGDWSRKRELGHLVAVLACYPGEPWLRTTLMATIWPGEQGEKHARVLSNYLAICRNAVGLKLTETEKGVVLERDSVVTDVAAFEEEVKGAARLSISDARVVLLCTAIDRYGNGLLPDRQEWLREKRDDLSRLYADAARMLFGDLHKPGREDLEEHYARKVEGVLRLAVLHDPYNEVASRNLMSLYGFQGRYSDAHREFTRLKTDLWQQAQLSPSVETERIAAQYKGLSQTRSELFPRIAPDLALDAIIGREDDTRTLLRLVGAEGTGYGPQRVVTLTGPSQVGKSRLAAEVAKRAAQFFEGAVAYIDMRDKLTRPQVAAAIARTLRLPGYFGRDRLDQVEESLCRYALAHEYDMSDTGILLVLDGCDGLAQDEEKAAGGRAAIQYLLDAVPKLACLSTARNPLGIAGEYLFDVLPLKPAQAHDLLFTLAREENKMWGAGRADAGYVDEICRYLNFLPGTISLVARTARERTTHQMLADLTAALPGESPVIEYILSGLREETQGLLKALAGFHGTWTEAAAKAVYISEFPWRTETDFSRSLKDLLRSKYILSEVTQTIVAPLGGVAMDQTIETIRYHLLDVLRAFVWAGLTQEEQVKANDIHANFFLYLLEKQDPYRSGPDEGAWLNRVEQEQDNLRAALEWYLSNPACSDRAIRLASAMAPFWDLRSNTAEGPDYLRRALEAWPHLDATRAQALYRQGILACRQSEYKEAKRRLKESLEIWRSRPSIKQELDGHHFAARVEAQLCVAYKDDPEGDFEYKAAKEHIEKSIGFLDANNPDDIDERASALSKQGNIYRDLGTTASNQGAKNSARANFLDAQALYEQALELREKAQIVRGAANDKHNLAYIALQLGDLKRSLLLAQESLRALRELDTPYVICYSLELFAYLSAEDAITGNANKQRNNERAVRLFAAAQALRDTIGSPAPELEQTLCEKKMQELENALGERTFKSQQRKGQEMTENQAIAYALNGAA